MGDNVPVGVRIPHALKRGNLGVGRRVELGREQLVGGRALRTNVQGGKELGRNATSKNTGQFRGKRAARGDGFEDETSRHPAPLSLPFTPFPLHTNPTTPPTHAPKTQHKQKPLFLPCQ